MNSGRTRLHDARSTAYPAFQPRPRTAQRGAMFAATAALLMACGPVSGVGDDPGLRPDGLRGPQGGAGARPGTGAAPGAGGASAGAPSSGGAGVGGGLPATGGTSAGGGPSECDLVAPQQTYVCAGWSYEAELAGAAELRVGVETCGDSGGVGGYGGGVGGQFGVGGYGGYGGYYAIGGQYAVGGYSDSPGGAAYGGQDGRGIGGGYPVPIGGAEQGGASSIGGSAYGGFPEAVGGAVSVGGWSYGGVGGDYYFPPTGGAFSTGGADGSTGPNWCDSEPRGTVLGGLSFAVGACQDIDVELPLVFEEPYSGEYVMHVYGGYGPCDRGTLLTTVAGVGRGQLLQVPFHTEGYTFISVEVFADSWYDFGVRLRDRPIVVPTAPPTE